MKWFIKCLRYYADFNGRARRKEYWMFALFNIIFAFAWTLFATFVFAAINSNNHYELINASNAAYYSYLIAVMLPGTAVAVRRLHDVGKSGWMIFVTLIPFVGWIWMLALMLTDGQPSENRYGPNPKTSAETFSGQAKLKNAGIVLIVASIALVFMNIINSTMQVMLHGTAVFTEISFMIRESVRYAAIIMLLIAGIFLLDEKQIFAMQKKGRNAMMLLLTAAFIFLILNVLGGITNIKYASDIGIKAVIGSFISIAFFITVALFTAFILFSSQNKSLIRNTAIWLIVFSGMDLLWYVFIRMGGIKGNIYDMIGWDPIIDRIYLLDTLFPMAFIVLAGTFLSSKGLGSELHQPDTTSAPKQAAPQTYAAYASHRGTKGNDMGPDKNTDSRRPSSAGNAQNVTFVRESRNGGSTWMTYKAPNKADAMAFLSQQQITRPQYYVVVETPEGNFGKDKIGVYQE